MATCSTTPRWVRGGGGALIGALVGALVGGGVAFGLVSRRPNSVAPLALSVGTPLIGSIVGIAIGVRKPNC